MRSQPQDCATSLGDVGAERLAALALRLGLAEQLPAMKSLFRSLLGAWSNHAAGASPPWLSDVCDDHTPFEFSIAIGGARPELRVMVESRGDEPTLASNQRWGLEVCERLRDQYGLRLDRLDQIRDLFLPVRTDCVFALWHAVSFWPGRAPEFKCYLNVNAHGPERAGQLVAEALRRLGFVGAWPTVSETILARRDDRLAYFSLDLSPSAAPRVKIYARHTNVTAEELEHACAGARNHQAGRVTEFCRVISGGVERFTRRGPVSCLSFVDGDQEQASAATIYLPLPDYAPNDRVARNRVASYLVLHELPFAAYVDPLEAFAARRLEDGIGMQSYASLRWSDDKPRVTVYFSPEAFSVQPPRPLLRPSRPGERA